MRLPDFSGAPLAIEYMSDPRACRGKLREGPGPGAPVHAGSFIRQRRIVLDKALLRRPREHRRILVHELFHFVWVRLGPVERESWTALIARETEAHARGELGWSAELAKSRIGPNDRAANHSRWRRYLSEAFCDTAAWLFAGIARHSEFTLARRHRLARRAWFKEFVNRRGTIPL